MASLPSQRPASQRRPSPPAEAASPEQSHAHAPRTNSFSAASVDSQTLLLNPPPAESSTSAQAEQQQDSSVQTQSQPAADADDEPRRCWICFNDETEDDETSSEWRSPCPCVLVAHEKCLLDWIADMEAPNARRRAGRTAGKILCPQCKSEIRLERPRSLAVEIVRAMEKATKLLVLPGIFTVLGTATYATLRYAGVYAVYEIFGTQDAYEILQPLYVRPNNNTNSVAVQLMNYLRSNWALELGLPAIPTVLIVSRTRIADSFLPFLPLVFLGSGTAQPSSLVQFTWPPSASFAVAALPYVRIIYNSYYDRVWSKHEQRWLREVQPRAEAAGEIDGEAQGQQPNADALLDVVEEEEGADDEVGDDVVELEVDVDLLFDWNGGGEEADNHNAPENPPVPIARGPARPLEAEPVDGEAPAVAEFNEHDDAAPAPNVPLEPAQPRRQRIRRERNVGFSTTSIADTILGALIFPSVAAVMGEALKLALPASWVTAPASGKPTGLLQAKWARSIVGGCLFVGLKDAVLLYVRWKMAQSHRQRRVLDYDGSKGKKKSTKAA